MNRAGVTNLKSASEDTDHEHDYRQIVGEHIPPRLQNSERWLLFRELPEFHYRNHDACCNKIENKATYHSIERKNFFCLLIEEIMTFVVNQMIDSQIFRA